MSSAQGCGCRGQGEGEGKKKQGDRGGDVMQYDYMQCTIPDMHGSPRGRIVPRHVIPKVLRHGFGIFQGIGNFGFNMEIPYDIDEYIQSSYANGTVMPMVETVQPLMWSSTPQRGICHTHGILLMPDGQPDPGCTRQTALRQVERLAKLGMTVKSAFELEFDIFEDAEGTKPLGGGKYQYGNMELMDSDLDFLLDMMDTLKNTGLPVELLNNEFEKGQYEITMEPTVGVESPDAVFMARYGIRAFCKRRGYHATFMALPTYPAYGSGFHFNHSLWTQDGNDVFFNPTDPLRLSQFARHWIAGLLHHFPALCALLCPTVNCYQRFGTGMAPSVVYWNIDDRQSMYRAKTSKSGAYLENRLASSASNPYLVFAATIAAGLDGVERQLPCPPPGPYPEGQSGPVTPKTLDEALERLQEDAVLKEAVGEKVVDYFTKLKRDFEIKHFKEHINKDMSRKEVADVERKYYMPFI